MRNERDMGNRAKETEGEEVPLRGGGAVHGRTGDRSVSGGDEDEDQILQGKSQGKSNALVRKAPGALVPRMSSALGQRPGITSCPPQLPPFGASPLFFGSWGPPGAMDPAWQAPQLQVPQFKSSFAADLFTGRYQLPAREASKSIWGPGSHSDDEEDTPAETRKMRLAPPTRRVPARPRAMKLIRSAPTNPDDSSDEDCILMGVGAPVVPKEDTNTSLHQRVSEMQDDEADRLLDRLERDLEAASETEHGDGAVPFASGQSVTRTEEPPAVTDPKQTAGPTAADSSNVLYPPQPKGKKKSPGSKRKGRRVSTPRKALVFADESQANGAIRPAASSLPASHNAHQTTTKPRGSLVIELPSNHLLDDGSYIDFSDMADLPAEASFSNPAPDDPASSSSEAWHNHMMEEPVDDPIPHSDRTIPDSQETPASLPVSSAPNAPPKQTSEKPRQDKQPEKTKKPSVYDLSDEEVGFLARPPRKRKRISGMTSPPTASERASGDAATDADAEVHASGNQLPGSGLPSAAKLVAARDSPGTMFSPIKTRSARAKANPSGTSPHGDPPSDEAGNSMRRLPRRRRLTPTSLNSADDTEGEPLPAQARTDQSLAVTLVSPPPDTESGGDAEMAGEHDNTQVAVPKPMDPESMEDALVIPDDDLPVERSPRSTDTPTTKEARRSSAKEWGSPRGPGHADTLASEDPRSRITAPLPRKSRKTNTLSSPDNNTSSVSRGVAGRSGGGRLTHGQEKEAADDETASSAELPALSYTEPDPNALPPPDYQLPNESQDITNLTPHRERHARLPGAGLSDRHKPATPSRTPKHKLPHPGTPTSVPSTGHRSLTSLVRGESPDDDSEDELTSSSLWSLFQKPTPTLTSSTKSARRRVAAEETPTKPKRRVSALRLSSGFGAERPAAPNESVMRTPGGTIRKCGERGLKCGKDFCFTCC